MVTKETQGAGRLNRRQFTVGTLVALTAASMPIWVKAQGTKTVAVLFDGLTSEFLVAGMDAMKADLESRGFEMLQAISNRDDNVQFEQVKSMIARRVDGIVIFHTDSNAVIPAIRAANEAGIPMVHFNRPPAESDAYSVAVVADNRGISKTAVSYMVEKARASGRKWKAAILIGNLGDVNAIGRRDGFFDAVDPASDIIEVVARIPTEWSADKTFAGLTNAMQANPDIDFLFAGSDFMIPIVEQVLTPLDKWHPTGHPNHVMFGAFDGDSGAYAALEAKYLDADGVQDLFFEAKASVDLILAMQNGERPEKIFPDPGFAITQDNLMQERERMWGYQQWKKKQGA
jgi:ABC-type sugar transport system substrate-binding protein